MKLKMSFVMFYVIGIWFPGYCMGRYVGYRNYIGADRIPGVVAIKYLTTETEMWITNKWQEIPSGYIRRPITLHDRKVQKLQNKLIKEVNELKKCVGIVYEEFSSRKMKLTEVEAVVLANNSLMKSRMWRRLRERNERIQKQAETQIKNEIVQMREKLNKLFAAVNKRLQIEYSKWAQENPDLALEMATQKKMAQLERRVQAAEYEAKLAQEEARIADAFAHAAHIEAQEALREAENAKYRANAAERRARDMQFQQDMNRTFNRNRAW